MKDHPVNTCYNFTEHCDGKKSRCSSFKGILWVSPDGVQAMSQARLVMNNHELCSNRELCFCLVDSDFHTPYKFDESVTDINSQYQNNTTSIMLASPITVVLEFL